MSITRINEFQAAPDKADGLFSFLKELKDYIAACEGCESCEVLRSCADDSIFVVIEKWAGEDAHKQSLANYPKDKMAAAMSFIGAPPKGGFYRA